MDDRYREIYAAIYVNRVAPVIEPYWDLPPPSRPFEPFGVALRDAVETAEERMPYRVREDAKALLALNFRDLVVTPLQLGGGVETETLRDAVSADVATLISRARVSPGEFGPEVTGHGVVDSLSENWSELRVSQFGLWE